MTPKGRYSWCYAFIFLALPVCVALAFIVPVGEVADEGAHLGRSVALTDGQLIGHRRSLHYSDGSTHTAAGVLIAPVWEALSRSRPPGFGGTLVPVSADLSADGRVFLPLYTIATYPPLLYGPSALGLLVGRSLGFEPAKAVYLGRIANTVVYIAVGVATLALATRGQLALFTILVLPMSLSLAASFNQDAQIIALSALAVALLTPCESERQGKRFRLIAATLILIIIISVKPPYAPLAAMLLMSMLPVRRFGSFRPGRILLVALVVVLGSLWTVATAILVATPVPRPAYEAGPLWIGPRPAQFNATDPGAQARIFLAEPKRLITLSAKFVFGIKHFLNLMAGMIGIFGWYDQPLPKPIYAAWSCALMFVSFDLLHGRSKPKSSLFLSGGAAILSLWLIIISQYAIWTNVGENAVYGPQGRYLIPLLPIFVLAMGHDRNEPSRYRAPANISLSLAALADILLLLYLAVGQSA